MNFNEVRTPGRTSGTNIIINLVCQSISENISLERSYFFLCWLQRWTYWVYNFDYVLSTSIQKWWPICPIHYFGHGQDWWKEANRCILYFFLLHIFVFRFGAKRSNRWPPTWCSPPTPGCSVRGLTFDSYWYLLIT